MIDGIAAVVNGEVITLLELEKAGNLVEARLRTSPAADHDARREVLSAVLNQLVLVRIQSQRSRQAGVQVSPAEIDTAILNIRKDNRMSEEVLARVLLERGMTQKEYRTDIEDQIRLSKLVQREFAPRSRQPKRNIRLVQGAPSGLVPPRKNTYPPPVDFAAERSLGRRGRSRTGAGERAARPVRGGMDFTALVRAETPGATADDDPVSGEMTRGELFPALETAAFALPVGGVSEPVQSPAGFHLVQVAEKTPAYEPSLEDVRASIEQKIAERKTRERYDAWLKQLRADAIVEIRY